MNFINKIFLFNLCECTDISARTILRLYRGLQGNHITEKAIKEVLGDTNTANIIIKALPLISNDYLSLFALLIVDINISIIEILRSNYESISDLHVINRTELKQLNIQIRTLDRIESFFNSKEIREQLKDVIKVEETEVIIKELIKLEGSIKINDFYNLIGNKYGFKNIVAFTNVINTLAKQNKIKITGNGIVIKKENLSAYLEKHINEREIEILHYYLHGKTLEETAKKYGVTKQRIDQIINKNTNRLPEFENEKSIYNTLAVYKLSKETIEELYVSEPFIPYYVKAKYKLNPPKDEIDYVIEHNLIDHPEGIKILKRNNRVFIKDQLYKIDFFSLFEKYLDDNKIISVNPKEHFNSFRDYLIQYNIKLEDELLKGISFETKIKHASYLLNYGNNNYYWFVEERYNEIFLAKARDYLSNFYGFGSVDFFYNQNTKECNDNDIYNSAQLFVVLKKLFENDFKDDIEFVRNPSIATKNLDKEQFLMELIDNWQPIKYDDFIDRIETNYGTKKSTFNVSYYALIQKYKIEDGTLSTNIEPIDENDSSIKLIRAYLKDKQIVPMEQLREKLSEKIGNKEVEKYTTKYFLKRLGYKATNYVVFDSSFNSVYEVVNSLCDSFDYAINQSELQNYYPIKQLDNRYDSIKQNCLLLRFSDTNFLNVKKIIDIKNVLSFRDELVNLLPENEIFTLTTLKTFIPYDHLLKKYSEIDKLIKALNEDLLISIIQSSSEITFYGETLFVFGKGKKVSPKQIIKTIVFQEESIDRFKLLEKLSSSYGIDLDITPGASFFAELGLYFCSINNTIYKTKELYNKELKIYLDSMEEKENVE